MARGQTGTTDRTGWRQLWAPWRSAYIQSARSATAPLHLPTLQLKLNGALAAVEHFVAPVLPEAYPLHWAAVKLLEGDSALLAQLRAAMGPTDWAALDRLLQQHADAALSIASARYDWIAQAIRVAVAQPAPGSGTLTARLDRLATHPIFGLGVLAAILAGLFVVTYSIGTPLQEWLEANVIGGLSSWLNALLINAPHWVRGLIVDGAVGGAGTVLTFVPILLIFFAGMALLEDVGYMARAAYLMDGFMRLMGLHGKSFLPLFLGFGCNVPAVLGTRVVESERARRLSIVLAPLVPCTARMAVVAFMAPAFFGSGATLAAFGLVMINLLALAVAGAVVLDSAAGSAPGQLIGARGGRTLVLMPGPSGELYPMFEREVLPRLVRAHARGGVRGVAALGRGD